MRKLLCFIPIFLVLAWPAPAQKQHAIVLTWAASTTPTVTYNVYRATISGGPYLKINASPVSGLTFSDGTGSGGTTYFYVATAVDAGGFESVLSNEASATFLELPAVPTGLKAVSN